MVNKNNNDKIDLNEVAKDTGEDSLMGAPRFEADIVRLNGKTGEFIRITKNEEGKTVKEKLPGKIKVVMLKFRRVLGRFTDEESFFTTEHSGFNDQVNLFVVRPKADGTKSVMIIDTGTAKEIKDKDSKLKMTQIIFASLGKETVKLHVKGSSLKNLYEFRSEISKRKAHFFQFEIEIEPLKIEGKLGTYFSMGFSITEELKNSKLKMVVEKIGEVKDKLESIDNYYKNTAGKEQGEKAADAIEKQIKDEDEEEEEINVSEIPFK